MGVVQKLSNRHTIRNVPQSDRFVFRPRYKTSLRQATQRIYTKGMSFQLTFSFQLPISVLKRLLDYKLQTFIVLS